MSQGVMTKAEEINPITLEVVGADLAYVVREMRSTVLRMAYSPILTETHDFFCGITNPIGEIVAINVDVPFHMFACRDAVAAVRDAYGDDVHPGDQFWLNDPWQAGAHLNDTTLLTPFFFEDELRLWIACGVHYGDVGGTVPGSASGECTEIFHEGIRVPAVRVHEKGRRNEEFLRILLANLRQPFEAQGVFAAQSNSTVLAQDRIVELYERYGGAVVDQCVEALLLGAEKQARESVSKLPDGEYFYEDYLENGGVNWPDPVYVCCKMTVKDDHLTFDFTGTSEQIEGVANCGLTNTWAAVFDVVDTYLAPGNVSNFGAARAFNVVAPEGTVVNSRFPAPVNGFATVMFGPIHGCAQGCLSQVMPEEVSGLTTSSANQTNVAGTMGAHREDVYWIVYEFPCGGWGATKETDGSLLCYQWHIGDIPVVWPIERIEQLNPIRGTFNEIYLDSGGPGYRRGGPGIRRAWEITSPGTFAVLGTDGILPRPGMCGGFAGALNWIGVIRDGDAIRISEMPLKAGGVRVQPGDLVLYLVAGGGGYGDPLKRSPELVLKDIQDSYVSIEGAKEDYGVIVKGSEIDLEATAEFRHQIETARQYLTIIDSSEDHYDEKKRRLMRISPDVAQRLSVKDGDVVEYVNPRAAHVRAWVQIDNSLTGDESPLGPRARGECGVQPGDRVHIRTPWTFCMRRIEKDKRIELPTGDLFSVRAAV